MPPVADPLRDGIDALIAAEVHQAERALNLLLQTAAHEGLDVNISVVDVSNIGHGHCELAHVSVRRKL